MCFAAFPPDDLAPAKKMLSFFEVVRFVAATGPSSRRNSRSFLCCSRWRRGSKPTCPRLCRRFWAPCAAAGFTARSFKASACFSAFISRRRCCFCSPTCLQRGRNPHFQDAGRRCICACASAVRAFLRQHFYRQHRLENQPRAPEIETFEDQIILRIFPTVVVLIGSIAFFAMRFPTSGTADGCLSRRTDDGQLVFRVHGFRPCAGRLRRSPGCISSPIWPTALAASRLRNPTRRNPSK